MMRSSPCIGAAPRRLTQVFKRGPNCFSFFGNIDPDRTPSDATAAAHATRGAELIDPVGQLGRCLAPGPQSRSIGGCKKHFQEWAHGIAEQRWVAAPLNPASPGILPIRPSDGKIIKLRKGVIDDGAVAHSRPDNPVSAVCQAADDALQDIPLDHELGAERLRRISVRVSLPFSG